MFQGSYSTLGRIQVILLIVLSPGWILCEPPAEINSKSEHLLPKYSPEEPNCIQSCSILYLHYRPNNGGEYLSKRLEATIFARLSSSVPYHNCTEILKALSAEIYMYSFDWNYSPTGSSNIWTMIFKNRRYNKETWWIDCAKFPPIPWKNCSTTASLEHYLKYCNIKDNEMEQLEWIRKHEDYHIFRLQKKNNTTQTEAAINGKQEETEKAKKEKCYARVNNIIALSVGLGITLIIFIIISIVLFVTLYRAKREIRCLQHEYVKSSAQTSVAEIRPQKMESVYDVIQSPPDSNTETSAGQKKLNRPTSAYENIEINTSPASNQTSADKTEAIDGIPVYAIPDNTKPRNSQKNHLVSPSDDMIIIDNELYA